MNKMYIYVHYSIALGLKPLEQWNRILMIKHLWNVASKKDSLWMKWVTMYRLKDRSIWEIPIDDKASRGWKKLLEFKEMVKPHVWSCLGVVECTLMWHDRWNEVGPVACIISRRNIFSASFLIMQMLQT